MPYLAESVASIRAQSFADFELLICDNASTDGTEDLVRELARADSRIRYLRVEADSGASANFSRCVGETRGDLFTWAASDDRFLPGYLEACVGQLATRPEHAMCIPAVSFIDETGIARGELQQPVELGSAEVSARLRAYLDRRSWYMVYGLIRRQALDRTGLFPRRFGPDVILVWELLLRFPIVTLDENLLQYRRYAVKKADAVWRGIQPEGAGPAPRWLHVGLYKDLLESCNREDLDPATRLVGRRALFRWLTSTSFRDLIVDDLRDEIRTPRRRSNPIYDAALVASMAVLRPGRVLRNLQRMSLPRPLPAVPDPTDPPAATPATPATPDVGGSQTP
jgi:glycosyltransferase involved in cell wall biosynthesis